MTTATRTTKRPALYTTRTEWWDHCESHRSLVGLPDYAFDFISIHHRADEGYTLLSPSCLLDAKLSTRPRFEKKRFAKLADAAAYAKRLARIIARRGGRRIHVVNCVGDA